MKNLLNYKSYIFISCVIYIFLYSFILVHIPEWFPYAYELGDIAYRLCFSYTTGFIFYILVTFLPKKADKKNIYFYADSKKEKILTTFDNLLNELIKEVNSVIANKPNTPEEARKNAIAKILFEDKKLNKNNLTLLDFRNICQLINPNANSPFNIVNPRNTNSANPFVPIIWRDQFKRISDNIRNEILEIFVVMPHLSTKHVKCLTEILESEFLSMTRDTNYFSLSDDLEFLHEPMFEFYKLMQKLREDWEKDK
jgi:hypothetical protein